MTSGTKTLLNKLYSIFDGINSFFLEQIYEDAINVLILLSIFSSISH